MGRNIATAAVAVWLILLAALFIFYQFGPFLMENRAPGYLLAALKVLAVLIAFTALGLRILGGGVSLTRCPQGLAVGLAVLAVAGLLVSGLGMLKPYVVYALTALAAAVSYRQVLALLRAFKSAGAPPIGRFEAAFGAVMAVALLIALINCLSPVTANDALVYHLNLPGIYCAHGGMYYLPFNVYANMPHYGEVAFTMLYSIGGEAAVKLFYFSLLISACLAVYTLVTRKAPRVFGILAASVFLVQPLVLDHRVVANIDIMLAFVYLAAIGIVLGGDWREGRWRTTICVAVLAGFMMGIKYTAVAPAISLLVLVLILRGKTLQARHIAAGVLVALLVFAPWPVRQGINTGNPFYPMLEGYFDGANWDGIQQQRLLSWQRSMGMGRAIGDYLALPFNISTRARPGLNYARFDGTLSPVFLILFPLIFIRRRRETLTLALIAIGLGFFWALTSQQLRFLLPCLALLAVLGAMGLADLCGSGPGEDRGGESARKEGGGLGALLIFMLAGVLLIEIITLAAPNQYGRSWAGEAVGERLGTVMGFEPGDRFLERTVQPFSLYRQADAIIPRGEAVFMVWENRAYHLGRPYFSDSFFEASTLMRLVAGAADAGELKDLIAGMGYRYILVNDLLGEVFARQYPREDIMKLGEFIEKELEPVLTANRVSLYRIR